MIMVSNNDVTFRLISAVQEGSLRKVRRLIYAVHKSSINSITYKGGVTALNVAADKGYLRIADYLLSRGACANSATLKDGFTSWHFSVNRNFKEIVKLLINNGANVNAKGKDGTTPLHIACDKGYFQIANLLLKHGANPNSVKTCTSHHIKNSKIAPGCTPLHLAVKHRNKKIVQLLLDNGAVINILGKDSSNLSLEALHFACQAGYIDIVKVLVRSGVPVNFKDSNNDTALHIATRNSYVAIIVFLLESAADIDAKDAYGRTALHIAAIVGYPSVLKILISYKADIEARDECGRTPLHVASQYSHSQATKTLLKYGSDINSISLSNYTPLQAAILSMSSNSSNMCNENSFRVECLGKPRIFQEKFVQFMKEHIVKMKIAHLYVCELNLKLINVDDVKLIKFQRFCEREIERLKSKKITCISLHDILTKSINLLAVHAGNKDIYRFLKSSNFEESFPLYAGLINTRFRMAMERKPVLETCYPFFYSTYKITSECTEKILSYLSNKDMKILLDAFKC